MRRHSLTVTKANKKVRNPAPTPIARVSAPNHAFTESSNQIYCRICLVEEDSPDNPLLAPCHCTGSLRYVHHKCLKGWFMKKRVVKKHTFITTFYWSSLECELCKIKYPHEIHALSGAGQVLKVIEYDLPK